MLLIKASATVTFIEDTVKPSFFLPGINSVHHVHRITRNKSLVGRHARAEEQALATERVAASCSIAYGAQVL